MKQLEKKDLIKGEIYTSNNGNIVQYETEYYQTGIKGFYIGNNRSTFGKNKDNVFNISKLRLATSEEKHWLEVCIAANSFISYEEAMKTFIPEYYEYIGETNANSAEFIKGKTYKIVNKNNLEATFNFIDEKGKANGWCGTNWKRFKPSTKEAYDAQFVVKEPEFVLPELWCIKLFKCDFSIT